MPLINSSAATNQGLVRGNNEDAYLSAPERGLWLVADGMGGHEAGEVASAIVVDTVRDQTRAGEHLVDAIQAAHEAVLKAVETGDGALGMGSTVVALQSDNDNYQVAWVGDSRAYLWTRDETGGTLEQLSTDHSYVQLLLASGAIQEAEVADHPDKNIITQCIGSTDVEKIHVDSVAGQWRQQQWILLCSDGLTDELDDEAIAQILCDARSTREATNRLMQRALNNGGKDNITLQIIESPLNHTSLANKVWEWLPALVGNRWWDAGIYTVTLACLLLLGYWLW